MSDRSWVSASLSVLHQGARLLALARQGGLAVKMNGHLRRASLRVLAHHGCLVDDNGGDCAPQETPALRFWVRLLEEARFLVREEGHLRASEAGIHWIERSKADMLDALRQAWLGCFSATWEWLPPQRRRHALDRHWRGLLLGALDRVAHLSCGRWTAARDVVAQLAERRLLRPREVAQNLPQVRSACEQRARDLLAFLFWTVLPGLGLVETRGSGPSLALRPTPEGADWLKTLVSQPGIRLCERVVPSSGISFPCAVHPPLQVDADLGLTVQITARPALTFEILHMAELISPAWPAHYRITRSSLQQAVAWGIDPANAILFLTTWHGTPLPERAVTQLEVWRDSLRLVQVEPGYRLRTAGPEVRTAMVACEPVQSRTAPLASCTDLWVPRSEAKGLFRYLRRQDYVLSLEGREGEKVRSGLLGPRSLPLAKLLVLLRTYEHLQPQIAGLPDLGLSTFERSIVAALSPGQVAAAGRLVSSNAALLDGHLAALAIREGALPAEMAAPGEHGTEDGLDVEAGLPHILAPADGDAIRENVSDALQEGISMKLVYVDSGARVSRRVVHPLRLETYGTRECLVAYCDLRQDERHFRLDRIVEARLLSPREPEDLPPF